jgi:hypothetical protein
VKILLQCLFGKGVAPGVVGVVDKTAAAAASAPIAGVDADGGKAAAEPAPVAGGKDVSPLT